LRRRCVVIELKKPSEIKSQKELDQIFQECAPHCYAYLVSCVQEALKNKVIDAPFLDLADFCEWVAKAHPVFFLDGRSFVETLKTNREQTAVEILETNIVASFIVNKVEEEGEWETTASDLLREIRELYPHEKDIPLTPEKMSREIKKIASDLEAFGVKVDTTRTYNSRKILFRKLIPVADAPTKEEHAKPQIVMEVEKILAMGIVAGIRIDTTPETNRELRARGMSVGKNGIYLCKTQEVADLRKKDRTIAPFYEVYLIDDFLKAFPETKCPKS
jgi:hypothetical protein